MVPITSEEILVIHSCVCRHFDQEPKIKDAGMIQAIAERPDTVLFGHEQYDSVFLKAACLMESILRWHPFFDGNKRTALMAATVYLHNNGYDLRNQMSDANFVASVAANEKTDSESISGLIHLISVWLITSSTRTAQ